MFLESNNCEVQVSEKIQIQRIAGSGYFKKFKELLGFMNELAKTRQFFSTEPNEPSCSQQCDE